MPAWHRERFQGLLRGGGTRRDKAQNLPEETEVLAAVGKMVTPELSSSNDCWGAVLWDWTFEGGCGWRGAASPAQPGPLAPVLPLPAEHLVQYRGTWGQVTFSALDSLGMSQRSTQHRGHRAGWGIGTREEDVTNLQPNSHRSVSESVVPSGLEAVSLERSPGTMGYTQCKGSQALPRSWFEVSHATPARA